MPEQRERAAALSVGGLDRAAGLAWRLLVVGAALAALIWLLAQLQPVLIGLVLALFLASVLRPVAVAIHSRTPIPLGGAAALALLGGLAVIAALWVLLVPAFVDQLDELGSSVEDGIDEVGRWLAEGPLHLSQEQIDDGVDRALEQLRDNSGGIASGFFSGALAAIELAAAVLFAIVAAFFLIRDGDQIWAWFVSLFSRSVRVRIDELGRRSWGVVGSYLRGVSVVAAFDAVLIGLGLTVLDVPAALPLAVLTFFSAFIPFAGALIAGSLAALVALVANGIGTAIAVVVLITIIQQIEGNLLYPLVVGRTVEIHPLASLLAVAAGGVLAGILGAVIAIPVVAMVAQTIAFSRELREQGEGEDEADPDPDAGDPREAPT